MSSRNQLADPRHVQEQSRQDESQKEVPDQGTGQMDTSKISERDGRREHICCMAVIGPNNALLYFRTFKTPTTTPAPTRRQLQEVVYNSIDVLEERLGQMRGSREKGGYLGCLAVVGNRFVYGGVIQGGYKVVTVIRADENVEDEVVKTVLREVEKGLVRVFMNVFWEVDTGIGGKRFEQCIEKVVSELR